MVSRIEDQICRGCFLSWRFEEYAKHLEECHQFAEIPRRLRLHIISRFGYQQRVHELSVENEKYQEMVGANAFDPLLCLMCCSPKQHQENSCSKRSARMVHKARVEEIGADALEQFALWKNEEYIVKLDKVDARLKQDLTGYPSLTEQYISNWISRGFRQYIRSPHGEQIHRYVLALNEKRRITAEREKEMKKIKEFIRYKQSGAVDPEYEQAQFSGF